MARTPDTLGRHHSERLAAAIGRRDARARALELADAKLAATVGAIAGEGASRSALARDLGISRETLRRILQDVK